MLSFINKLRWRTLSLIFALFSTFCSLLVYWTHPAFLERLDEIARDIVFNLRDTPLATKKVAIVAVDEKSVRDTGRWPWDRTTQALLIEKIKSYGAKVIGLDIIYLYPQNQDQDQTLSDSIAMPGGAVIGGYFFRDNQSFQSNPKAMNLLYEHTISQITKTPDARDLSIQFPYVEVNQLDIASAMAGFGFFNYIPSDDGLIRNTPLILAYQGNTFPSLALKSLATYLDQTIKLNINQEGYQSLQLGDNTIPIDRYGRYTLNFYAADKEVRQYSASDILWGELKQDELRDTLVFVGVTELGIADVRPTPVSPNYPGVAIHATIAANILQNFYLERNANSVLVDVLLIILIPLLLVLGIARLRKPLYQFAGFVIAVLCVNLVFLYFFKSQQLVVSLIYPLMSAIIGYASFQVYYILVSQRHTRFLRTAFSTYVSPNLVSKLIAEPEKLRLVGERREITVLFSDIRDFTQLSENLTPETLVHIINTYLDPMTELVMDRQGTLDKYIGDALMAIYNAPLDVNEHPRQAAETALAMIESVKELNKAFKLEYDIELNIGIGIHSGPAVVGNMGSSRRFDYTAMGDTVNLASRLEARTKYYGSKIIISESTYQQIQDIFLCRMLDKIRVKGKLQPVAIYELIGKLDEGKNQELYINYEQALDHYLKGDFRLAIEKLEALADQYPQDKPTQIILQRCRDYHQNSPENWDGVFVAKDK